MTMHATMPGGAGPGPNPSQPRRRLRFLIGLPVVLWAILTVILDRPAFLGDPDIFWHIKTGAWIWQHAAVPTTDPFSHSYAGHPWMAKEWLSQLIFNALFALGQWNGVVLLGALIVGLSAGLIYHCLAQDLRPGIAAAITILCLVFANSAIMARPHLLTLPLLVVWTHALFAAASRGRAPPYGLLVLLLLWANLHAAFTMGFVIAAFAALAFVEQARLSQRRELLRWLGFLALCPLVTLIHPYGYRPMLATLWVIAPNQWVMPIAEWQAFNAQDQSFTAIFLLLLVVAAITTGLRVGRARALLVGLLAYLFLTHVRYAFFFFPVMALVIGPELGRQFRRLSFASWHEQPLDPFERRLARAAAPLASGMIVVLALLLGLPALLSPVAPPESVAASRALAFASSHHLPGHVLNHYNFGGSLVFNGIPSFIDGRTDQLFLNEFVRDYATGPKDEAALAATVRRYGIGWTLLPPGDLRLALLDGLPQWNRVYADDVAVIHQYAPTAAAGD